MHAVLLDGEVSAGGNVPGLPWKLRVPAHGSAAAREAPIASWCGCLLRSCLHVRREIRIEGSMLFAATRKGRPWGKVAQYASVQAVLAAAGLPDSEGGDFKLRRCTAPEQVAQGLDLPFAAELARYRCVLLAPVEVVWAAASACACCSDCSKSGNWST